MGQTICVMQWREKRPPPLEIDQRFFGRATTHYLLSIPVSTCFMLHAVV
jgi:hypothetical protein